MPSSTEGMPSMMNSHCQPFSPITPSSPSNSPEIGAPITVETGTAMANAARKRARYSAGYQ